MPKHAARLVSHIIESTQEVTTAIAYACTSGKSTSARLSLCESSLLQRDSGERGYPGERSDDAAAAPP